MLALLLTFTVGFGGTLDSRAGRHRLNVDEIDKLTSKPRRKFDIEDEYNRLQEGTAKLDIDNWEQKRIPRPGGEAGH